MICSEKLHSLVNFLDVSLQAKHILLSIVKEDEMTDRSRATHLNLGIFAYRYHKSNLFQELGVHTKAELHVKVNKLCKKEVYE